MSALKTSGSSATKPAITVADIIFAIEDESVDKGEANATADAYAAGRCSTDELWASLNRRTVEFLDSVSLQSLVDEQLAKGVKIEDEQPAGKRTPVRPAAPVKPLRVNAPNSVFALGRMLATKR